VNNESTVFIVDEDQGVRKSLSAQMDSLGFEYETFHSNDDFLNNLDSLPPGCLMLDVRPPDLGALELLERINGRTMCIPAVVISAYGEVAAVVRAMRSGALNYLKKPCSSQAIVESVQEAFNWDRENRRRSAKIAKISRRLDRLTRGEHEVLDRLILGKTNKDIAADLSVSLRAVEVRRSKLMRKMNANSLADLIQMTMLYAHSNAEC
jgi:two-component system, LuxR family, response regulator FixJ